MTIIVNIMIYHLFMYIFSIDTINLRNKTLSGWRDPRVPVNPRHSVKVSRCIRVITCWPPTPICCYWGCESEQLSGCASLTGCTVLWFGRPYTTGPPRVVYKAQRRGGEEQQYIHDSIALIGILYIHLAAWVLSCYLYPHSEVFSLL